jgi:hypothetical protein
LMESSRREGIIHYWNVIRALTYRPTSTPAGPQMLHNPLQSADKSWVSVWSASV